MPLAAAPSPPISHISAKYMMDRKFFSISFLFPLMFFKMIIEYSIRRFSCPGLYHNSCGIIQHTEVRNQQSGLHVRSTPCSLVPQLGFHWRIQSGEI